MSTYALEIGETFEADTERPYIDGGIKETHRFTAHCTVTAVNDRGFDYVVDSISNEQDRPAFAEAQNRTAVGGSMAWFALPLNIRRGRVRITAKA